jgi:preprotein translocase subunit SecG
MNTWFWITTILFALVAVVMVLIILVQRPQGGGLAGAFGGAGGSSTETVFGGRVGDALTYATVTAFVLYLGLAISLNLLDSTATPGGGPTPSQVDSTDDPTNPTPVQPGR